MTPSRPDVTGDKAPLIRAAMNKWEEDQKYLSNPDGPQDPEDGRSTRGGMARSRHVRKAGAFLLLVLGIILFSWNKYLRPLMAEDWLMKEGFLHNNVNGTYGIARAGHFNGMRIKDLDSTLVPGGTADPDGVKRLIFIGDIHGCKTELTALLSKVQHNGGNDHVIATGDVVSKGPDNAGVLDELIRLGAESVRGNHEDRLLEIAKKVLSAEDSTDLDTTSSKGNDKDKLLLKHLKPRHIHFLRQMPLMLRIPALPSVSTLKKKHKSQIAEPIIVVHAGLVPNVPLEKQDPYYVMNMRSIDHRTHVPSALHGSKGSRSKPWLMMWNWFNDRLARGKSLKGFALLDPEDWLDEAPSWFARQLFGSSKKQKPQVVIYGHDSKAGLQMHRWSKGLDTACVAGGKLTAMVLDARGKTELVHVKCKDYKS